MNLGGASGAVKAVGGPGLTAGRGVTIYRRMLSKLPALSFALMLAAAGASADPLVLGSEPAPLVFGSDTAPIVRQAPDFGRRTAPGVTPLHRRALQERLDDLERAGAKGDLGPLGRRELQDTRQELHDFDRSR